jgi:hypothetical protein
MDLHQLVRGHAELVELVAATMDFSERNRV